jgi:hypothetical protein
VKKVLSINSILPGKGTAVVRGCHVLRGWLDWDVEKDNSNDFQLGNDWDSMVISTIPSDRIRTTRKERSGNFDTFPSSPVVSSIASWLILLLPVSDVSDKGSFPCLWLKLATHQMGHEFRWAITYRHTAWASRAFSYRRTIEADLSVFILTSKTVNMKFCFTLKGASSLGSSRLGWKMSQIELPV